MSKKYLDYAGLKRVLAKLLPGARKIWHGTLAEWEALPLAEKKKYDQAEITGNTIAEYSDTITIGDKKPLTSNGLAKWFNYITRYFYSNRPETWVAQTTWTTYTFTFNNVEPGKYLIQTMLGSTNHTQADTTIFMEHRGISGATVSSGWIASFGTRADYYSTCSFMPAVVTVTTKGTVTITIAIHERGSNYFTASLLLFRFA